MGRYLLRTIYGRDISAYMRFCIDSKTSLKNYGIGYYNSPNLKENINRILSRNISYKDSCKMQSIDNDSIP